MKRQIQTNGPNDFSDWSYSMCGATFLQFPAHNFSSHLVSDIKMEEIPLTVVSSSPVIYELSLNVYRDIRKKNKAWKEVAQIVDDSGECT